MSRRIGLLGGTFDPMHRGHLDLALAAQRTLGLTSLLVVPSHVPPHRTQPLASPFHRFAMVAIAIAGHRTWQASDIELRHPPPSYTSATLRRLHESGHEPQELFFIVGADAFADITSWKGYPEILDGAHFAVISRPGHPVGALPERLPQIAQKAIVDPANITRSSGTAIILIDATTANVSATAIRDRIALGRPIADMVSPGVGQHIEQHGLYSQSDHRLGRTTPGQDPTAGELHG